MLRVSGAYSGQDLPAELGGMKLSACPLDKTISIAPFKGQVMAVADVLRPAIGMILPPVGHQEESEKACAFWYRPGQWLVSGKADLMQNTCKKLAGMAAVADMSDAFFRVRLEGRGLDGVMARLSALDLALISTGGVAHTALSDIPVTLLSVEGGYELLIPRSFAASAVSRLKIAMRSSLAREMITNGQT